MRTLAIETATEACSVALFEDGEVLMREHRVLGRGHAELLVPMISDLPEKGRAGRILVSLGPGSFTGVRIGIATARALGFAWSAEVLGYPTLALVATMARADGPVTACMAGGHGEWFVADFTDNLSPSGEMASLTPEAAVERGARRVIAGSRASEFADLLADGREFYDILPDAAQALSIPDAILTRDLSPIYGRAPDAKPQKARLLS